MIPPPDTSGDTPPLDLPRLVQTLDRHDVEYVLAAMLVKLAQVGGKRVGGTERGSYNCTAPGNFTNSQRLSDYGRKVVRRHADSR